MPWVARNNCKPPSGGFFLIAKKCSKIKSMDNVLPTNEFVEIEGRQYLNPQTSLDESNAFIENLRATQGQQNQQIASDTYNLGTDIQSVQGGLGTNTPANMGYFTSRYQTPQTNSAVANLRAAAQASALNEVLANEQAIWKKRYNDAYKAAQRRASARSRSGGGGGGGTSGGGTTGNEENTSTWGGEIEDIVSDGSGGYTAVGKLTLDANDLAAGGKYVVEPGTGNIIRVDDTLDVNNPNYQTTYYQQSDGSYATRNGRNRLSPQSGLVNNAPLAGALRSSL